MDKITDGNDPVVQTVYRQTGKDSYRPATQKEITEGIYLVHKEGLTKREYYAGLAMQGLCANPDVLRDIRNESGDNWDKYNELFSALCVMRADSLIASLNQPSGE